MTLFYVNYFCECLSLFVGLCLFKRLQPPEIRLLVGLLLITVINEGAAFRGFYPKIGISKNYGYVTFFLTQSLFFWIIFRAAFATFKSIRILDIASAICILLEIVSLIIWGAKKISPWFLNLVCLHMILIGVLYYISIYSGNKVINVFKNPFFWLVTGVVFVNFIHWFFVNATFIKSFANSPSSPIVFKSLNTMGNMVYYSLIIYAFICSSRLQKWNITS